MRKMSVKTALAASKKSWTCNVFPYFSQSFCHVFRILSLLSVTFFRIFYASSVTFSLKYKTAPTLNADAVIILFSFYSLSYRLVHLNTANGSNRFNLSLYALPDNELSLAEAVKCSCTGRGIGTAARNQ